MTRILLGLPDRRLVLTTVALVGLGVVMVYASSTYRATVAGGTEFSFAARHTVRALLGLGVMFVAAYLPYRLSCRLALYALPVAVVLLALTVLGGGAVREAHGIGRWLSIFGVIVQPVELAKLSLALAIPWWIDRHPECTSQLKGGFLQLAAGPALVILLLVLQPNFGSALALGLMSLTLFWLGGVQKRYLATVVLAGGVLCWLGYLHVGKLHERVDAWLGLLVDGRASGDYAYQSYQALVGLGSGGLEGVGPGLSTMKYLFLPASHTDFIFAILGEELGFLGAGGLIVVLMLWFARTLKVAHRAPDGLAYLVALGIGSMILSYALLNLAVVVALMPVTGLPLPFLSYGGSALVTNLAGVGVLLSVTRHVKCRRAPHDRWRKAKA